jgi:LDH2 family malate/lactate/ureidoglycolate dehydrogenase
LEKREDTILIKAEELRQFCNRIMRNVIDEESCKHVVDSMIQSNLRGVDTHGVVRIYPYAKRFSTIKWKKPEIELNHKATALLNGNNSAGQVCAAKAMEIAIDKAQEYGIGMVGVKNSNHFGTAAYYTMMATEKDMIGFAFTNASPRIAPWGGKERLFGNNPWSYAFPTNKGYPVVFDISNSVVAAGKIRLAALKGEEIPEGWAMDKDGVPTQNPEDALKGLLNPIGNHKGYGITFVMDVLSGILTGSGFAKQINGIDDVNNTQNVGHLLGAINIKHFMGLDDFLTRIEELINLVKTSKTAKGVNELFVPGEIEQRVYEERLENGIPLTHKVIDKLNELADEFGESRL